jgi:hypothetical protein
MASTKWCVASSGIDTSPSPGDAENKICGELIELGPVRISADAKISLHTTNPPTQAPRDRAGPRTTRREGARPLPPLAHGQVS